MTISSNFHICNPLLFLFHTEKMAIAASENYQLKWHSYGAHLHSSVATLLHSESFADVLLATSCGRHVAAHRFVLAACSSYLSHIFQTCHFGANTNAPIIVVSNSLIVGSDDHFAGRLYKYIINTKQCDAHIYG
jgi:hypothetical protein